jgi:hypothetical protein
MAPTETLLATLSRANPIPEPGAIASGGNTYSSHWKNFDDWEPWHDFNAKTLGAIYKDIVQATWKAPQQLKPLPLDMVYGDEDGLEHQVLSRFIIPTVNAGLAHAKHLLKHNALLHLGRRGRCGYDDDNRFNPDWSLVSNQLFYDENQKFISIMNGDTKLSAKWEPDLRQTKKIEWRLPIRQVLTYANQINCRYGFIITDDALVVFQFAREVVGPGLATTRETR